MSGAPTAADMASLAPDPEPAPKPESAALAPAAPAQDAAAPASDIDKFLDEKPAEPGAPDPMDDFLGPEPARAKPNLPDQTRQWSFNDQVPYGGEFMDAWIEQSAVGKVLSAFGQGAKEGWGDQAFGKWPKDLEKYLRDAGILEDLNGNQRSITKAFNEVLIRPAAVGLNLAIEGLFRGGGAVIRGAGAAVIEAGLPRDFAAIPEAFPAGHFTGFPGGISAAAINLQRARSLGVIGGTEAEWAGTRPRVEPTLADRTDPAREAAADAAEGPRAPGAPPEAAAPLEPGGAPAGEPPAAPAPGFAAATGDVHAVAREIAPDTFRDYDALAQRKETFGRWIDELGEQRASRPEAKAAQATIDGIMERVGGVEEKLTKAAAGRLDAARAELDRLTTTDTADMARVRADLQKTDFAMRDLAPEVSRAYREAGERVGPDVAAREAQTLPAEAAAEQHGPPVAEVHGPPEAPRAAEPAAVRSIPDAAFNGDLEESLTRIFHSDEYSGQPVALTNRGFRTDEVSALQRAGLADAEGRMDTAAFGEWMRERVRRLNRTAAESAAERAGHAAPEPAGPREEISPKAPGAPPASIADRVTADLVKAGRPEAEAQAAASIIAAHYEARAARFGGARGTAAEMYERDAPDIRGGKTGGRGGGAAGKLAMKDGAATITLFEKADASTVIHETGHAWLEELMGDAKHEAAPAELQADARAVRAYIGAPEEGPIQTRAHEKFARAFEQYMREGHAPNKALADVFGQFKTWLTSIYDTVKRLGKPINDDIRAVFDRMIDHPDAVVAGERETPRALADQHETLARDTPPDRALAAADKIRAEADQAAHALPPEIADEIGAKRAPAESAAPGEPGGTGPDRGNPAAGAEADRHGNAGQPGPEGSGAGPQPGEVGARGAEPAGQGAGGDPRRAGKPVDPTDANEPLGPSESRLIDKAGNIRIDNLNIPEDVAAVIREAAERNGGFVEARRGTISDAEVLDMAEALGMDATTLLARNLGEAFNAEEIVQARKLLIQSARDTKDAMAKAAIGTDADVIAFAEAKARHQMIQEQVAGLTAEAGRALRAFRALDGMDEAKAIGAVLETMTGKTLFQMRREAQLGAKLETPQQVSRYLQTVDKPTWKDMVIEAWMSALLSGPTTHVANVLGNSIVAVMKPVESAVAGVVGGVRRAITGSTEGAHLRDAQAELFGIVRGAREGIDAGWKAYSTEEPQFGAASQAERAQMKALPSVNIGGMDFGGKQARIPLRLLGAEDEFFKAIAFRGEVNRLALKQAIEERSAMAERTPEYEPMMSDQAFNQRVAELSVNPTEAMIASGVKVAEYQTFQTPLGKMGQALQNISNSSILAKAVMPFVRTPLNLLKYAGERTPLGIFSAEVRANLSGRNGAYARDTQIARMAIGTAIGVGVFSLASEGLVTGGGPTDPHKRAAWLVNHQPYSVKIGSMWVGYNRLDPFSAIMGTAADGYEVMTAMNSGHPETEHLGAMIFGSIAKNVLNRTSLQGPAELMRAATDPERYGQNYINSLVGSVVPGAVRQIARGLDPIVYETRDLISSLKASVGWTDGLHPKRDLYGEPVRRESLGSPIGSPFPAKAVANDPIAAAMERTMSSPAPIDRKIRGVDLTDQQYDDFSRIAGRMTKIRLDAIVRQPGFDQLPIEIQRRTIANTVTQSRDSARQLIMMQNPGIITAAVSAKVATFQGSRPKAGPIKQAGAQ